MLELIKRYIKFEEKEKEKEKFKEYLLTKCSDAKIRQFITQLEELLYFYKDSVSRLYTTDNYNYRDFKRLQNKLYSTYFKDYFEKSAKEINVIYKKLNEKCKELFIKYLSELKESL